ncbi:MAG TPA: protein kinase [Gemmatimonadales bacterium]|nr:protein kinase [Gemmatimonadales bacterium]
MTANGTVECVHCHTPLPTGGRYCSACGADQTGAGGPPSTTSTPALEQRLQRLVASKYKIERLLGKGGMGAVFLAHDLTLEREVAIKVLPPDVAQDDQVVRRFHQEAKTAARLDHPNIIPIYRVESEGGLNYFVMKYVAGTSLEDVLARPEPLAPDYIQRVLWEAACALGHAHQRGVVHRDVKPANIMFDHEGRVMLTDFGISKALQAATGFTATGMLIGTPHYMAPEQAKGTPVDGRADQYSLGVVGYRMITGDVPFYGDSVHTILYKHIFEPVPTPKELPANLPRYVWAAIARAMAKEPGQRFPTMEEFATAVWPEHPVAAGPPRRPSQAISAPGVGSDTPTEISGAITDARTTPMRTPAGAAAPAPVPQQSRRRLLAAIVVVAVAGVAGYLALGRGTGRNEPAAPAVETVQVPNTVRVNAPLAPARRSPSRSAAAPTAPPPPAAQAQGYLTVNADPYGELFVDGVDVGPTPVVRYAVPPGVHTVKVVREGYRTVTERVHVDAGNTVPKRYTLIPEG